MKKPVSFFLLFFAVFSATHCQSPGEYWRIRGKTQGTTYSVVYQFPTKKNFKPEIDSLLHHFDRSLSTYDSLSTISRINRNQPGTKTDSLFRTMFREAQKVHAETGGAFDITVAPLVNAYGFGFTEKTDIDSALIDSLLQFVGMNNVRLSGDSLKKQNPGIMLDPNAIAQGQAVDVVAAFLEKQGVENYLVEIGGEVKVKGKNYKGTHWRVGIDKPIEGSNEFVRQLQAIVLLADKALATSGNYRKFYEENGIKYSHSIDPKTGYPARSRLLSATIVAPSCISADAYATACMVMGLDKSIEFVQSKPEIEAYFIFSDEKGKYRFFVSKGLQNKIKKAEE